MLRSSRCPSPPGRSHLYLPAPREWPSFEFSSVCSNPPRSWRRQRRVQAEAAQAGFELLLFFVVVTVRRLPSSSSASARRPPACAAGSGSGSGSASFAFFGAGAALAAAAEAVAVVARHSHRREDAAGDRARVFACARARAAVRPCASAFFFLGASDPSMRANANLSPCGFSFAKSTRQLATRCTVCAQRCAANVAYAVTRAQMRGRTRLRRLSPASSSNTLASRRQPSQP